MGFMDTKTVTITGATFSETVADAQDLIVLTVKNTGTSAVTIASAKVNGATASVAAAGDLTIPDGGSETLTLTADWVAGNNYKMDLYDANGQLTGSYQAVAA